MASAPATSPPSPDDGRTKTTDDETDAPTTDERIAALEAALERADRRREAAEEWATFLERELQARDERLEAVIGQYEAKLEEAHDAQARAQSGRLDRLRGALRRLGL